jgi:LPXTG-site transpeptidase (sortase) family protein
MPSSTQQRTVPKHQLIAIYRQAVKAGLSIDVINQKVQNFADRFQVTVSVEEKDDKQQIKKLQRSMPLRTRIMVHVLPVVFVGIGIFLVSNAAWPILSYFVFPENELVASGLLSPVPNSFLIDTERKLAQSIQAQASTAEPEPVVDEPIILADQLDYTNLNNWFPNLTPEQSEVLNTEKSGDQDKVASLEYSIDIPTVNIQDARVKIGGTNLDKSLIQYPGTANPGDPGSPVIFGHSVLRQFYNPSVKNPRRYMSIFSKIMTLKSGDKIYVTRDGVKYTYTVQQKTEVKPEDVFILQQNYEEKTLKLITCVPEGTYLRRGVIIATLDQ